MTDTLDEIKHDKESMSGKIRIGTLTGLGKSWLSPQLLEVASKNRELDIHITLGFQEDLVREFNNYRLDILILPEDSLPQKGERVLIAEEKASLVYPKKGDYGIDQKITLEEFAQFPTVLFEHDDPLYMNWCRKKFGRVPRKVNAKFVVNSHGNMLMAVNMGIGVAVIPNHVLERSYYRDKVQTLGQNFEVSNGKFYLLHHKGALDFVRFRYVIDWLKNGPNPFNRPLKNT
jgi:DNA-binding transcriptional LysR family regulator